MYQHHARGSVCMAIPRKVYLKMDPRLDRYLTKRYPEIFKDRDNPDSKQTLMCFGFEHGSGWFWIIDALCAEIMNAHKNEMRRYKYAITHLAEVERADEDNPPECPYAVQVKEKYGTLRFYVDGSTEGWGLDSGSYISMMESYSSRVCENCGAPGIANNESWVRTECADCNNARMSLDDCITKERHHDFVETALAMLSDRERERGEWDKDFVNVIDDIWTLTEAKEMGK